MFSVVKSLTSSELNGEQSSPFVHYQANKKAAKYLSVGFPQKNVGTRSIRFEDPHPHNSYFTIKKGLCKGVQYCIIVMCKFVYYCAWSRNVMEKKRINLAIDSPEVLRWLEKQGNQTAAINNVLEAVVRHQELVNQESSVRALKCVVGHIREIADTISTENLLIAFENAIVDLEPLEQSNPRMINAAGRTRFQQEPLCIEFDRDKNFTVVVIDSSGNEHLYVAPSVVVFGTDSSVSAHNFKHCIGKSMNGGKSPLQGAQVNACFL